MCRLGCIPDPSKFTEEALHELFDDLTQAYGGDGVGMSGYRGGIPKLLKGVNMDELYLAQHAVDGGPWDKGVIYHTRLATNGAECDFFCHPFETPRGFLAHNGIWADYPRWWNAFKKKARNRVLAICDGPKGVSDSYVMAQVYKHLTARGVIEAVRSGVVIMQNKDKWPMVYVAGYGDFQCAKTDFGWVYASQIPYTWGKKYNADIILDVEPQSVVVMKPSGPFAISGGMVSTTLQTFPSRWGPSGYYSMGWSDDDDDTGERVSGGDSSTITGFEPKNRRSVSNGDGGDNRGWPETRRDSELSGLCHHVASGEVEEDIWSEDSYLGENDWDRSDGGLWFPT